MLKLQFSSKYKKDYKLIKKRGYDESKLIEVIKILQQEKTLDVKYKDHALIGDYEGYRECHIESDWLLIYKIENKRLILVLSRTGTHSDLF
ncbi:type II toxin-antitoxin system RelE/ParE family toxin [Anaerosinus gibii]|uniref:Type II toxin-antitoxin system YafQ family toxin n=1 Tax=Selenobaculum gibii TaxID=3054208 RepID=A0A9Y2AK15_9FIRM|nr:type II toxin-antitoxin system YafQ family toxin [Selenobaculum gbiensis]WIW70905.1 type II toxin-antitoxin system YafQ family toxin [Selenobaculum gbiensis]